MEKKFKKITEKLENLSEREDIKISEHILVLS